LKYVEICRNEDKFAIL